MSPSSGCLAELMDCSESSFRARGQPQGNEKLPPDPPAVLRSLWPFAPGTDLPGIRQGSILHQSCPEASVGPRPPGPTSPRPCFPLAVL